MNVKVSSARAMTAVLLLALALVASFGAGWTTQATADEDDNFGIEGAADEAANETPDGAPADAGGVDLAVIGGENAVAAFNVVALLFAEESDPGQAQFCGGTVVAPAAVLTAAHCVGGLLPRELEVLVGTLDLSSPQGARVPVARIDVHPMWRDRGDFDIAVVHLAQTVDVPQEYTYMQPPVWLRSGQGVPPRPGDWRTSGVVHGWGCMLWGEDGRCAALPYEMQYAHVDVLFAAECEGFVAEVLGRTDAYGLLCAGGVSSTGEAPGTCFGDSGGPLGMAGARGFPLLVGLTSWGISCGYLPGVYTHVAAHHTWIVRQLATSPATHHPVVFSDVSTNHAHSAGISSVAAAGIAGGFSDGRFGPEQTLTRGQMATFLARALYLPRQQWFDGPYGGSDVSRGDPHAEAIAGVVTAGIAGGFPDGTFRPSDMVNRGQMATFLARAFQLPPGSGPLPFDVRPDNVHAAAIRALTASGVTTGFSDGSFRPGHPVTRGQMATFLERALNPALNTYRTLPPPFSADPTSR